MRNADPITHALTLLGSFPESPADGTVSQKINQSPAILRIEKTALSTDVLEEGVLGDVRVIESTDIARSPTFVASRSADEFCFCVSVNCSIPGYLVGFLAPG